MYARKAMKGNAMQRVTSVGCLEHVNLTVKLPKKTAAMLCRVFGWHIRWEGPSLNNGYTVHVGNAESYVALYAPQKIKESELDRFEKRGGLNHIAVVVKDFDAIEDRVKAEGYRPKSHAEYEPGRRFYFLDDDRVEYEVVSYERRHQSFQQYFLKELGQLARFGSLMK